MDIVVIILTVTGLLFFFATTVGLLRFPDFYSRMHAAGKGDTMSSLLMLLALVLYNVHELNLTNILVALKMLLIVIFIFMAARLRPVTEAVLCGPRCVADSCLMLQVTWPGASRLA